ncbi:unnamed protein product [Moneuplotes crassus]|uniref:Uncharacterized protein n=1 Tax=Euplotes crassus TaxID=5936 RepID=A0AAD1Y6E7_EUPCR|nr:unnamed protein product [Moneuplotes crassus]
MICCLLSVKAKIDCFAVDGFGQTDCARTSVNFVPNYNFITKDISEGDTHVYIMATNEIQSPTLFLRYNPDAFTWNWRFMIQNNKIFEKMRVTPNEKYIITSLLPQDSVITQALYIYKIDEKSLIPFQEIFRTNSQVVKSINHIEVINNTNFWFVAEMDGSKIQLISWDIESKSGTTLLELSTTGHNFGEIYYDSITNSALIMYQIKATNALRFGGTYMGDNTVYKSVGMDCTSSACSISRYTPKTIDTANSILYTATNYDSFSVLFFSLKFKSNDIINGKTFASSSGNSAESIESLTHHDKFIYILFKTGGSGSKSVLAKYSITDQKFTEYLETDSSYIRVFHKNTRIFFAGNKGEDIAVGSCYQDFSTSSFKIESGRTQLSTSTDELSPLSISSSGFGEQSPQGSITTDIDQIIASENTQERVKLFEANSERQSIKKGSNSTIEICLPYSHTNNSDFKYSFKQIEGDKMNYIFSYDPATKKINLESKEYSLEEKNSTFRATATSQSTGNTYETDFNVNEGIDSEDPEVAEQVQKKIILFGVIISIFGALIGGTLIQAAWIVINQQKLLLFFILINTYMDVHVRLVLTIQSFGLFNFSFLNAILPDFIASPSFIDKMSQEQETETLEEIGLSFQSFIKIYWIYVQVFMLVIIFHLTARIFFKLFPILRILYSHDEKGDVNNKDLSIHEENSQNNYQRGSISNNEIIHEESKDEENKDEESKDEENKDKESKDEENKDEESKDKEKSKSSDLQEEGGGGENCESPFKQSCAFQNTNGHINAEDSKLPNLDLSGLPLNDEPDYPEEQKAPLEEQKEKIPEQIPSNPGEIVVAPKKKRSLCKIFKNLFKRVIPWVLKTLDSNFFYHVYFRMIMESYMGVMIVTVNEIKTNGGSSSSEIVSLVIAYIFFLMYLAFYAFICLICYLEYKKRTSYYGARYATEGEGYRPKDAEKKFYGELFKDLNTKPYAVFHQPLNLGRILVMVLGVMVLNFYDNTTVWAFFLIIYFLQIGVVYQAKKYPKFTWWPLKMIYLINEVYLLLFVGIFGLLRSHQDWENPMSKSLVLTLIFTNTVIVLFFQICGNYIQTKKVVKDFKDFILEEDIPEPAEDETDDRVIMMDQKIQWSPRWRGSRQDLLRQNTGLINLLNRRNQPPAVEPEPEVRLPEVRKMFKESVEEQFKKYKKLPKKYLAMMKKKEEEKRRMFELQEQRASSQSNYKNEAKSTGIMDSNNFSPIKKEKTKQSPEKLFRSSSPSSEERKSDHLPPINNKRETIVPQEISIQTSPEKLLGDAQDIRSNDPPRAPPFLSLEGPSGDPSANTPESNEIIEEVKIRLGTPVRVRRIEDTDPDGIDKRIVEFSRFDKKF